MTTTFIQPPPQKSGMGCLGKGCLILIGLAIFLIVAFAVGGFVALRHVRTTYLPGNPRPLPSPALMDANSAEVQQRWETFQSDAEAGRAASLTLTEAELNALLESYPDTRGKYRATVQESLARLQVTLALDAYNSGVRVWFLKGRYLNADCIIEGSADGDPRHAKIREIKVNEHSVPDEILDWNYGSHSVHGAIGEILDQYHVTRLVIANGAITVETKASDNSD